MLVLAVQVNADQQEVDKRVLGCFTVLPRMAADTLLRHPGHDLPAFRRLTGYTRRTSLGRKSGH